MKKPKHQKGNNKISRLINNKVHISVIALLVIIAFSKTSNFDFVDIDDERLIYENPLVTDSSIPYSECFTRYIYNVHYKPFVYLTWKAEYQLLGKKPGHFHTINWLLHLASSIFVFLIGLYLFKIIYEQKQIVQTSAFALALLFALNPLRLESVAWATERKDVLFMFFFLLGWISYFYYLEKERYIYLVITTILYLCTGFSKSMGITLIAVLFLTDFWYKRKFQAKLFVEKIPVILTFILLLYLYGLLDMNFETATVLNPAQSSLDNINNDAAIQALNNTGPFFHWIITTSVRFILWLIHILIPVKLSVLYPHNDIFIFLGKSIFVFPIFIVMLFIWSWIKRRDNRALLFSLLFFIITISPALALRNTGVFIFLSDRYTYVASIGIAFLIVYIINQYVTKKMLKNIIYLGIFLFYFVSTVTAVDIWKNSENLFKQALEINPKSSILYLNLGKYYLARNNIQKAEEIYSQGIEKEIHESYKLHSNRGGIYLDQGNLDKAIQEYNRCLSVDSNYVSALVNRGLAYTKKQELNNALQDLNKALKLSPSHSEALYNRGMLFLRNKEYNKAITDLEKAVKFKPDDSDLFNFIGLCHSQLNEHEKAVDMFTKAINIDPQRGLYYFYRSFSHNSIGNKAVALKDALKAKQLGHVVSDTYISSLQ